MGGIIICSLIWYYFPVYGGVHWFTGPVRTTEGDVSDNSTTAVNDSHRIENEKRKMSDTGSG